jgi:hypothetical protein
MLPFRPAFGFAFLVATAGFAAADQCALTRYERAEIAPAKTSIYIGSVTMTMPTFIRAAGTYEAAYKARVMPYYFSNEAGQIRIHFPDASLLKLEAGEAIEFTGLAVRNDGLERRVEGKATPSNQHSGRIKVRVFVSKNTELIFNTTYRFPDAVAP